MEYIPAKTIVTKTKSSAWFGIDYNMNIYHGTHPFHRENLNSSKTKMILKYGDGNQFLSWPLLRASLSAHPGVLCLLLGYRV